MNALFDALRYCMQGLPQEVAPGVLEAAFHFEASFVGFDGHFPDNPLVPGVAQVMAVALTVSPGGDHALREIRRAKFTGMIRPGDTMLVRAVVREEGDLLQVSADCVTASGPCASLKLTLAA